MAATVAASRARVFLDAPVPPPTLASSARRASQPSRVRYPSAAEASRSTASAASVSPCRPAPWRTYRRRADTPGGSIRTVSPPWSRLISRPGHSRRGQVEGAVRDEIATAAPASSRASRVCPQLVGAGGARSSPSRSSSTSSSTARSRPRHSAQPSSTPSPDGADDVDRRRRPRHRRRRTTRRRGGRRRRRARGGAVRRRAPRAVATSRLPRARARPSARARGARPSPSPARRPSPARSPGRSDTRPRDARAA